jgi:hypothetical protein
VCNFVYLCVLGSACVYVKLCHWTAPALLCRGASSAKSASSVSPLLSVPVYLKLCQWTAPALLCRGASSAKSASSIIPLRRCLFRISKACAKYNVIRYTNTHTNSRRCTETDRQTFSCSRTRDIHSPSLSLSLSFTLSLALALSSRKTFALSLVLALASRKTHTRAR